MPTDTNVVVPTAVPLKEEDGPGTLAVRVTDGGQTKRPRHKTLRKYNSRLVKGKASKVEGVVKVVIQQTKLKNELKKGDEASSLVDVLGGQRVVYLVEVRDANGDVWVIQKEYLDFRNLHHQIKSQFPGITRIVGSFPSRSLLSHQPGSKVVEDRKMFFQAYLQALLQLKPRLHVVNEFLELKKSKGGKHELTIDDFELLKVLGKGSFGKVFLVRVLGTMDYYAMKVLNKVEVKRRRQIEHTKTELQVMGGANHPFICSLRYAFNTKLRLFMVSDFCQGGELFYHLKQMKSFTHDMVRYYSAEIALALEYLHKKNIVYRDIKPENVLLDDNGHINITDFGLSRMNITDSSAGATTFCGTPEYLSPEMLLARSRDGKRSKKSYGFSVDWWGLGILMYEMFFGWPPFFDKNKKRMCHRILRDKLTFPNLPRKPDEPASSRRQISPEAKDVITGLLNRDPARRLGIVGEGFKEIQVHPFYESLDWEALLRREIEPPFKPNLSQQTGNFEAGFTNEPVKMSDDASKKKRENGTTKKKKEEDETTDVFKDFAFSREDEFDDFYGNNAKEGLFNLNDIVLDVK